MKSIKDKSIGTIEIKTVPLPEHVREPHSTYTYSGKVLTAYKMDEDEDRADYYHIAVLNDDGTEFKEIFAGEIPTLDKANGVRFLPFQDDTRIILGDYILECTPNVNECIAAELVRIIYPKETYENQLVSARWSEIIVAPDNEHMSWSILRSDLGVAVCIGRLVRTQSDYELEDVKIISTLDYFLPDQEREGYLVPQTRLGGEVKQFVNGGRAISLVGQKSGNTPNSVLQKLDVKEQIQITNTPGYDETTILSPDEKLGITMSTRGSRHTNPGIFGVVPRPYGAHLSTGYSSYLYVYSVTGVRNFRKGNVGPVLIEIEKSISEEGYNGIQLNDPNEEWVYESPMSWHPGGKKAMWRERLRGTDELRVQFVELLDYQPGEPVPFGSTPDDIPYAISDLAALVQSYDKNVEGKIAGKEAGFISYKNQSASQYAGQVEVEYHNFSDDGAHYYNGSEKFDFNYLSESVFRAEVELTGPNPGEMKFQITFAPLVGGQAAGIIFEEGDDGLPKSRGYADYKDVIYRVEDLEP